MKYLFYSLTSGDNYREPQVLEKGFRAEIWRPSYTELLPEGIKERSFVVWWLFHQAHIFSNRDYGVFVIRDSAGHVVHRSTITPRYFRFPFMGDNDLQIGDVWTAGEFRGRNLATFALASIVKSFLKPGRKMWYVTEGDNEASVKLTEKAGFIRYGEGERTKVAGVRVLGTYKITRPACRS